MWITVWKIGIALIVISGSEANFKGLGTVSITRHHKGDMFSSQDGKCYQELCLGISSGTASATDATGCNCQCMPNLPVYRDDLSICVDDIQECTLAPFLSGSTTQKIPYVFLPLRGQIVYPSAEIMVSEGTPPICVVSKAQFLGRRGWLQLRNNTDAELPFRLFRDKGRTHLQWMGEGDLRLAMEGRLIMVHLMCKDAVGEDHKIFTPCIAFRVAGNPSGVREMLFATDKNAPKDGDKNLSVSEYIAIGICILLMGLAYVASVFLYVYFRKKKRRERKKLQDNRTLSVAEEGIVKSNPLLQATRRHLAAVAGQDNAGYTSDSGSCCSESDRCSDIVLPDEDHGKCPKNMEIAAMVHPCTLECIATESILNQENSTIEKLPEENVSIVETLEGKEERPETVRSMGSGNVRRKLYFNPAYFELDMLKAPPPAALEFLTKIREVIAIAKHKMSAKRFSPSLIGIPEEDYYSRTGRVYSSANRSRPSSLISYNSSVEKQDRNRKTTLTCTKSDLSALEQSFNLGGSGSCCQNDTKQRIIRKWLEDVSFVKKDDVVDRPNNALEPQKKNKIVTGEETTKISKTNEVQKPPDPPQRKENRRSNKSSTKGPAPPRPPPLPSVNTPQKYAKPVTSVENCIPKPPPPPMPSVINNTSVLKSETTTILEEEENTPRIQGKDKVPPVVAKTLMDAVIKELIVQRKGDKNVTQTAGVHSLIKKTLKSNNEMVKAKNIKNEALNQERSTFEQDSLERKIKEEEAELPEAKKGEEIGDLEQKPAEESVKIIDSQIEIYNDAISPVNADSIDSIIDLKDKTVLQDDHDYEVILLNPAAPPPEQEDKDKDIKIYNLPEILSKNDRSEGYSLVSEVYVNDGYSYSSDGSSQSNHNYSTESNGKLRIASNEKPGLLTIHVKDSPDNYIHVPDETDSFEPDTLDRKSRKFRYTKTIGKWQDNLQNQYSNQRFHEMDMECQHSSLGAIENENYIDSLERPQISLKSNGSFKRSSLERDVNELFRNLEAPLTRSFGSLREIYEAKSKDHRRRTETTSLVGSVRSDVDCNSTLSWREDRRHKLLHRGIVLHLNESGKRHRSHKQKSHNSKMSFPDVVPPRPPKPSSNPITPNQRSQVSSPANRSNCVSPVSRSACTSPTSRSNCPSPRPPAHFVPSSSPPPAPPRVTSPRGRMAPSPPHSGRASPNRATPPPPPRSICSSPTIISGRTSPARIVFATPPPPPRTLCSSPISQSGRASPSRTFISVPPPPRVTAAAMHPKNSGIRSPCTSPEPPPRPLAKPGDNSPPLPPRSTKPPLPPKNSKSSRSRKSDGSSGRHSSSLARRPLPPIPSPRNYQDSTLSSVSSRDLETLSTLSGASIDSLNSSDYEAFYTLPYDSNEGESYDTNRGRLLKTSHKFIRMLHLNSGSQTMYPTDEVKESCTSTRKSSSESGKSRKKTVQVNGQSFSRKPEDSGYLSTDSESGRRQRRSDVTGAETTGSQGSETEESLCDGASESGAESIATDSFFFGNFNRTKTAESLDSGIGSELNKNFVPTFKLPHAGLNQQSEDDDVFLPIRQ